MTEVFEDGIGKAKFLKPYTLHLTLLFPRAPNAECRPLPYTSQPYTLYPTPCLGGKPPFPTVA